jgi:S-disulfanyl-L-cysteine oxidoreductase SoxD
MTMQRKTSGLSRVRTGIAAIAATAGAVLGLWIATGAPVGAQTKASVWDGVYSEAQATRGKDEYEYNCGNCHIHDLSGDSIKDVPPLAGSDFIAKWQGKSVKELIDYIATNMPQDSRGSLDAKTYADITAYVLKVNTFPAGAQALADAPALATTMIEREKKP